MGELTIYDAVERVSVNNKGVRSLGVTLKVILIFLFPLRQKCIK